MIEGLIQAYFAAFARGWQSRDDPVSRFRDSPREQSTLSYSRSK